MGCYGLGSVFGALIGGFLTDKVGYFKVMFISLMLTAIAFFVVMVLNNFYFLCVGIFLLSLIADAFRPANLTAIEAFSKKENMTRSLSLVRLAINLGYSLGPLMGGYIATILGYNFLFIFNGTAILIGGIVFYFLFKNKKQKTAPDKLTKEQAEHLDMPWANKHYMIYLGLFTVTIIVFLQLLYTVPLFFKTDYGFSEAKIGIVMALNGLIIAIFEMPLIFTIEKIFRPVKLVVIGGILMGVSMLMLGCISHFLTAALLFTLFITIGEILSFPFSNTYAMSFSKDHNRGKYMGLYTMTFSIAHVIGPMTGLTIAENFGFSTLWVASAVICIIASLLILTTKMRKAQVR